MLRFLKGPDDGLSGSSSVRTDHPLRAPGPATRGVIRGETLVGLIPIQA